MRSKDESIISSIGEYINTYFFKYGISPSLQEIADDIGISKSTVSRYLSVMQQRGLVESGGGWRSVQTSQTKKADKLARVPIVGEVACGTPLLAQQNLEGYLSVSASFLGEGSFFALRAHGDSMINAGIEDGDYVIIRSQSTADEGQIVVALIDDEATLKRFFVDGKNRKIRLHAENEAYEDMYFDNINIQGVAKKIIKEC